MPCARCGTFMCDWCEKLAPDWAKGQCWKCQQRRSTAPVLKLSRGVLAALVYLGFETVTLVQAVVQSVPAIRTQWITNGPAIAAISIIFVSAIIGVPFVLGIIAIRATMRKSDRAVMYVAIFLVSKAVLKLSDDIVGHTFSSKTAIAIAVRILLGVIVTALISSVVRATKSEEAPEE